MQIKSLVRKIQNDNGRQKIGFPGEIGWRTGDIIQFEKVDEHRVVLNRLHT